MSGKRSKYLKRLGSRGDTIVEVLLAIAVVSAVLSGAFVSANHSFNNTRQSQERGEANEQVEGQVERLKQAVKNDPTFFTAGGTYCLDDALARRAITDAVCKVGSGGRYQLSIERAGNSFAAMARWDRFGGGTSTGGQEEVKMVYRLYP